MRLLTSEDVGFSPPEEEITGSLAMMGRISFRLASSKREEDLWRYLIQGYHYLGYRSGKRGRFYFFSFCFSLAFLLSRK